MVYTNLWQNPDFSSLSDKAKLLYIGTITVADDDGRLRGNSLLLRSQIFPFDEEVTITHIRAWLNEIVRSKLVTFYKQKDEYFIQHPNWKKYQYIRADIYKKSKIPPSQKRNKNVTKVLPSIVKYSKDKNKREHSSIQYLKNIPQPDIDYFINRFQISTKQLKSKAEDLFLYCKSHGRQYRNYKAFMLNSIKKDFPEKKVIPTGKVPVEQIPERTPEEQARINAMLKKTRETIMGNQK